MRRTREKTAVKVCGVERKIMKNCERYKYIREKHAVVVTKSNRYFVSFDR